MTAKVVFPPKLAVQRNNLYEHHSTGPAGTSRERQWVPLLHGKGDWVLITLVRCLSKQFPRISNARASTASPV